MPGIHGSPHTSHLAAAKHHAGQAGKFAMAHKEQIKAAAAGVKENAGQIKENFGAAKELYTNLFGKDEVKEGEKATGLLSSDDAAQLGLNGDDIKAMNDDPVVQKMLDQLRQGAGGDPAAAGFSQKDAKAIADDPNAQNLLAHIDDMPGTQTLQQAGDAGIGVAAAAA